jgi:hypothetical protein
VCGMGFFSSPSKTYKIARNIVTVLKRQSAVKYLFDKILTLCVATVLSTAALISAAYAANPYNKSDLRIDEITIPSTNLTQTYILKEKAYFSKIILTIKPLQFGKSDGKGLNILDSNGELISFAIADIHQMLLWHDGLVAFNDSTKIALNVEYDFIVYVKPSVIEVWYSSKATTTKVLQYNHTLKAPLKYYLFAQRTGAIFRNIIIKEQ